MLDGFRFHHLGVATESIDREVEVWKLLGYRPEGKAFIDETQGIRGLFMIGNEHRVELLEPHQGSTTLAPWLKRQNKFYHIGYLVASLNDAIAFLISQGGSITRAPARSSYFQSEIAFLIMPNLALVELIDSPSTPEGGAT